MKRAYRPPSAGSASGEDGAVGQVAGRGGHGLLLRDGVERRAADPRLAGLDRLEGTDEALLVELLLGAIGALCEGRHDQCVELVPHFRDRPTRESSQRDHRPPEFEMRVPDTRLDLHVERRDLRVDVSQLQSSPQKHIHEVSDLGVDRCGYQKVRRHQALHEWAVTETLIDTPVPEESQTGK